MAARPSDAGREPAPDEGGPYAPVAEWRPAHEPFRHGESVRTADGTRPRAVDDGTRTVTGRGSGPRNGRPGTRA
ncbi:hypothetical protein ACFWUW_31635, partial [Streptomyces sp. NPDC058655]